MQELQQFSKTVAQSKMVPKKYRGRPQDVVVAVMHGMELGLPPLQALQSVAVINGRPSIYGDAALAVVRRSGLLADIKETVEGSGKNAVAYCTVKRADTGEVIEQRFSWEEAVGAGLTQKGGPWQDYPRRMLQMRARSWCLRDAFPEVLKGMMLAEEAEAIPQSNGETLDPKGEMERPDGHTPQIVEWESPHGRVYEVSPGKHGSLKQLSEALREKTGDELAAGIEETRSAWDWEGEADTALDSLLAYHAQRLADEEGERPESGKRQFSSHEQAIKVMCPRALEWGQREDPPPNERQISSEKKSFGDTTQLGRLFRIADQEGWKDSWLDRLVKDELGFESKTHIPYGDPYDEICAALRNDEVRFWMSRDPDTRDMEFEESADEGDANHPEFEDDSDLPF
jgi:hypothetical protein